MIKAVFCDLGGVLVLNRINEVTKTYETEFGLTRDKIKDVFKFIQSGTVTDAELENYLVSVKINPDVWQKFVRKFFSTEVKNQKLYDILKDSKTKGVKIFLTTNNAPGMTEVVIKHRIFDIADDIVNSSDIGVSKPDPSFWELAYDEASRKIPRLRKSEILVIDDSRANTKSALNFGLNAIQYTEKSNDQINRTLDTTSKE